MGTSPKGNDYNQHQNLTQTNGVIGSRLDENLLQVWHPAQILVADGDTGNVVLLGSNEVHTGASVEDLRPFTEFSTELYPRERLPVGHEDDQDKVELGIEKAKVRRPLS